MDSEQNRRLLEVNGTSSNELASSTNIYPKKAEDRTYSLSPWRWVIVISFAASFCASGLGMMGFSTVTPIIQVVYGISDFEAQLLMLVFVLFYIPLMFPANYLIEHKGIVIPLLISSFSMLIGAWLRMLINTNFYFVIVGQCFMALGQPFMCTVPAKLAGLWFSDKEQALATTIGSLAQPLGAVMGFLLPLPFIHDSDKTNPDAKAHFKLYILVQSIVVTVLVAPLIFTVRNRPKHPPSRAAQKILKMKIDSQFKSIWKLLKNLNFIFILFSFSFIFSVYVTLGASVGQLTEQFGFGSKDNSIFGTVFVIGGLVGSFVHAIPLDMYQYYRLQYITIGFTSFTACIAVTLGFETGTLWVAWVALVFLGASQLPIIGISYAFAAETTYPINEAHSWGFLQLVGSILGSVIAAVVGIFLDNNKKYYAMGLVWITVFIGFLCTIFTRDKLFKTMHGKRGSSISFGIVMPAETIKDSDQE